MCQVLDGKKVARKKESAAGLESVQTDSLRESAAEHGLKGSRGLEGGASWQTLE